MADNGVSHSFNFYIGDIIMSDVINNNNASSDVDSFNATVKQEQSAPAQQEKKDAPLATEKKSSGYHLMRHSRGFMDGLLSFGESKLSGWTYSSDLNNVAVRIEDTVDCAERIRKSADKAMEITGETDGKEAIKSVHKEICEYADLFGIKL